MSSPAEEADGVHGKGHVEDERGAYTSVIELRRANDIQKLFETGFSIS